MAPRVERHEETESAHRKHLGRSAQVSDRWSRWYGLNERDFAPHRRRLIDALALERGDHVLEVGCGPGVTFAALADRVGPEGSIAAIDYSPAMVERARAAATDVAKIHVSRADASTADLGGPYEAAIAVLVLSVVPDLIAAVDNIHDALARGGSLAIIDVRPFPTAPQRMLNPLLRRFLVWYANWNPDEAVDATVAARFDRYDPVETALAGAIHAGVATKTVDSR